MVTYPAFSCIWFVNIKITSFCRFTYWFNLKEYIIIEENINLLIIRSQTKYVTEIETVAYTT